MNIELNGLHHEYTLVTSSNALVTSSDALVTSRDALVTSSFFETWITPR